MSKQTHTIPPEYVKGFNQGYLLAKEIPDFTIKDIEKMPKAIQEKPRINGIKDGMRQYHHEKYLSKVKSRTPQQSKNITPNKGLSRN